MSFFDRKEQVLDLQLTQHGKRLLSQGKLKPVFYAFYDDDVLYDSSFGGNAEGQSEAQTRIQEAVRNIAQHNFEGVESKINSELQTNTKFTYYKNVGYIQTQNERDNGLRYALGTSEYGTQNAPAWEVSFLNGALSGSSYYFTGSNNDFKYVPQLESDVTYEISIKNRPDTTLSRLEQRAENELPQDFENHEDIIDLQDALRVYHPDGTYVDVDDDYILLQVSEKNSVFSNDNFELEVFEILPPPVGGVELELRQLSFAGTQSEEFVIGGAEGDVESDNVEQYITVEVDEEINPELLVDKITDKLGSVYLDKNLKRVAERLKSVKSRKDLYTSNTDPVEVCE